ncbi:MAG: PilW family protein [Noviherbaspirillum sp.]
MTSRRHSARAVQAGFGLAEIMVGLAIGMVTTLVITQAMSNFEGQKRTTTGSADAQVNGNIALYTVRRQIQMASFGLPVFSSRHQPLDCSLATQFDHDGDPGTPEIGIDPIAITEGPTPGASDTIAVTNGDSQMGGSPIGITNVAGNVVSVTNNLGCQVNDVALVSNGSVCSMSRVTALGATTQVTLQSAAGADKDSNLACMGQWTRTAYSIANNTLMETGVSGVAVPSVAGIVNIQAQYGVSNAADDNRIAMWIDAGGAVANAIDFRKRIKAVRVAIVARNGLLEKDNVTAPCSSLTTPAPTGLCAWAGTVANPAPAIDLSNDPDWRRYRYRVFETTVPLRNVIWSRKVL